MPISHPSYYATLPRQADRPLRRSAGRGHLGAERGRHRRRHFLQQAHDIDDERRAMFFAALDQLRAGTLVCVFDATDRIQHMFWRYLDAAHPAGTRDVPEHNTRSASSTRERRAGRRGACDGSADGRRADGDLGSRLQRVPARRQPERVAAREGYLTLPEGADGSAEWLRDVDWSRTRAYCVGLDRHVPRTCSGREQQGVVAPGAEAAALKAEIIGKLNGLRDAERDEIGDPRGVRYGALYSGPYLENAPGPVHRLQRRLPRSWDGATGMVAGPSSRTTPRRGAATTASIRGWCRVCSSATGPSPPRIWR